MLTYTFKDCDIPLYIQLYEYIKKDIFSGQLCAFEKLPSKRKLSIHLSVGLITVENAYMQLIAEGYIFSKERQGYFVSECASMNLSLMSDDKLFFDTHSPKTSRQKTKEAMHSIQAELFPFSIWSKLMRQVISKENKKLLLPIDNFGVYELREAIAEHLHSFRGIETTAHNIIIGAGAEYLYSVLIKLLGSKSLYAIEDPGYQKINKIYKSNDVSLHYVSLDENGCTLDSLKNIDVIHLSPAHQFPSGIVMPIKRRLELLQWAQSKKNRYIIEDDYDSEFRFFGKIVPPLMSIDKNESVIYLNTFSKTIAPSIRISYMVLPQGLLSLYEKKLGFYSCTVSSFEQYTLAQFIKDGYLERHLGRMRNFYRKKRDSIILLLESSSVASYLCIENADSGLHFLLHVKTSFSDERLSKAVDSSTNFFVSLSHFFEDKTKKSKHVFVVNYASFSDEHIKKCVKKLEEILKKEHRIM